MKKLLKWVDSLSGIETAGWTLALVASGMASFLYAPLGALLYLWLLWIMWRKAQHKPPGTITMLIIAAMILTAPAPSRASMEKPECNAFILGGMIIVVGGYVVYRLIVFCKKHFPPPTPAPVPPPPPAPVATNKNGAPTNTVNARGWLSSPGVALPSSTPIFEGSPVLYDISTNNWTDATGTVYQDFSWLVQQSSVDMVTWTNYRTFAFYLNTSGVLTVGFDNGGLPVVTNWAAGNPYTDGVTIPLPMDINRGETCRFFR